MNNKYIENISTALGLIAFGIVALLVTMGQIELRDIFMFFFRYWPILLIFAGFKLIVEILPFGRIMGLVLDLIFYIALIFTFLFFSEIENKMEKRFGEYNGNGIFIEIKDWKERR